MQLMATMSYPRSLYLNDTITCIYLPISLAILHYSNLLFKLGSFEYVHVTLLIAAAEILKYIAYTSKEKTRKCVLLKESIRNLMVLFIMFTAIYIITVLLGAPVFSQIEETAMFAFILVVVAVLPLCLHLGPETTTNLMMSLVESYQGEDVHKAFLIKTRFSLFGAWLGATVIPLDWNRPWQEWPIPCYIGGLGGYIVGNAVTAFLYLNWRGKKTAKQV